MTCPSCGGELVELERSGVRVDACRNCRGVWLDRGELDKILERSTARESRRVDRDDDDDYRHGEKARESSPRKRRGGFFGELFDFGD